MTTNDYVIKTTAQWKSTSAKDIFIPTGCICIELLIDNNMKIKIGDGKRRFPDLPYISCHEGGEYVTTNDYIIKTSAQWSVSPSKDMQIKPGCICIELLIDNNMRIKIGDGVRNFAELPYVSVASNDLSQYAKIEYVDGCLASINVDINAIKSSLVTTSIDINSMKTSIHSHHNKAILDETTATFTTEYRDKLQNLTIDDALSKTSTNPIQNKVITNIIEELNNASTHTHTNKEILDATTASYTTLDHYMLMGTTSDVDALKTSLHNHINRSILDGTTASFTTEISTNINTMNTDVGILKSASHIHTNKTILDGITASYTTTEQAKLDDVIADVVICNNDISALEAVSHTHSNKTILDGTTSSFTIAKHDSLVGVVSDVSALKITEHTHSNKTVLDNTTASFTTEEQTKLNDVVTTAGILSTDVDILQADSHTHSNKTILDNTTSSFTTEKDNKLSGLSNYIHPNYTSETSGLYKITVDETGHVSDTVAVVKTDITDLGVPAQDTVYTLPTAGLNVVGGVKTTSEVISSVGLTPTPIIDGVPYYESLNDLPAGINFGSVKSGGDVNIVDGVISVNDDSHNHVISNIDGLQTTLDNKLNTTSALTLGETSSSAYRGDYGKTAYDHSQITGNPHGLTKADIGLDNVENVVTNDQMLTYTVASSNTSLTSGEKLSIAFGKIAKIVSSFITHVSDAVAHITSTERTTWDNKVDKSVVSDKVLVVSTWSGSATPYTYTLSVTGVTTTNDIDVSLNVLSLTDTQITALMTASVNAQIFKITQDANNLKFYAFGTKPTVDIPLKIIIRGDI